MMSVVISIILVTLVIAAMMIVRLVTFQRALDARLKAGHGESGCDEHRCFQGCVGGIGEPHGSHARNQDKSKRSDSHAS